MIDRCSAIIMARFCPVVTMADPTHGSTSAASYFLLNGWRVVPVTPPTLVIA
jgi:hypothetical protein